jgi:hypothetical protein
MATFCDLLSAHGIDPREVLLLRHQTRRGNRTPYWLWENDRSAFFLYQATQQDLPRFRKRYWASFVSPAKHETMFVGLFETRCRPDVEIDWRDQLDDGPIGGGKPKRYFYYECGLSSALSEHIGRLRIDWGPSLRQWTQYASHQPKSLIGPLRRHSGRQGFGRQAALARSLALLGFTQMHRTQKVSMFRDGNGTTIYLKNESGRCPLVIHPYYERIGHRLGALPGIRLDEKRAFYVNSNLSAFPIYRDPKRVTTSRYGIALDADDAASIARLVALLRESRTIVTPIGEVVFDTIERAEGSTQREALCLARIGQGQFRLDLNQQWSWQCALTGLGIQELLRASHIKAWCKANDTERLDPYNGLLLAAHVDALFDKHLLSFADDGRLLVSSRLKDDDLRRMGIDPESARIEGLDKRHRTYLAHHRARLVP